MTIITIVIDEKGDVTIDVESFTGMGSQTTEAIRAGFDAAIGGN